MDYVPQKVKDLFIEFFKKCSLFKGKDYKKEILNITVDEEERMDLEELFQATEDFYAEREALQASGLPPHAYLEREYLKIWEQEHLGASEEDRRKAVEEMNAILSESIIIEMDALIKDGQDDLALEHLKTRIDATDEETRERIIDEHMTSIGAFECQSEDTLDEEDTHLENK